MNGNSHIRRRDRRSHEVIVFSRRSDTALRLDDDDLDDDLDDEDEFEDDDEDGDGDDDDDEDVPETWQV